MAEPEEEVKYPAQDELQQTNLISDGIKHSRQQPSYQTFKETTIISLKESDSNQLSCGDIRNELVKHRYFTHKEDKLNDNTVGNFSDKLEECLEKGICQISLI